MRTNKKQRIKIAMAVIAAFAAFSLVVLLVGCSKDKNDPPISSGTGNIGQTESGSFEGEDDPLSPLGTEDGKSTTKTPDKTNGDVTTGNGPASTSSAAVTTKNPGSADTTKGPEDTFAPAATTKPSAQTTAKPTPETSKPAVTTSTPSQTTAKAPATTTSKIIELPFVPF